jgi:PAS domain S-box-containing protein
MEGQEEHTPSLILVVDDERIMREGCARICQSLGCQVLGADGGEDGLRVLREQEVDVLLLDLMMPGISGMEVLERMQTDRPGVVVIVITGYATVELAVEAMKRGAYDFISKPFTPDQLRLVVKRALEKRRLQQEAERLREERARSLRDVAQEQSRLRTIIHSMADGVLVTDPDGVVVLHNPPAGRLLGRGDLPILGCLIEEAAPDNVSHMIRQLMAEPPGTARSVELRVDGVGDLRAHGSLVLLSGGEVLGSVTVIQDVTPLKEMDRMKSDFVAMVSHELRSPLSAIQQQLQVMEGGMAGEVTERQRSLLSRARQRSQGLLDLINDLLDLARIEAGRVVERKEPLQLEPLVERTVELFQVMAKEKGLQLIREPFPPLPFVVGDGDALEEVISNLLSNAIAYTPSGGEIRVRGGKRGAYLWVEVADTGVGIPPEAVPRIFDRFFRVKDERTRHVVGTGLGLPIAKGIMEAHLGAVEVESEPGKGSTFRILIPEAPISLGAVGESQEARQAS